MPIEPVKIPQNVYVEDRVVGPLTLRQTIIMTLGGGFSYVLYMSLEKVSGGQLGLIPTVLVWIPCALAVLFSIIRVNDLSLLRICLLLFERMEKPPKRSWAPRQGLTIHIRTSAAEQLQKTDKEKERDERAAKSLLQTHEKIDELSSVLDRPMQSEEYEEKVQPQTIKQPDEEEIPPEKTPRLPVNPQRISTDGDENDDGLSAFQDVFRDISPKF